ncbi:MAG: DUF1080 domain-containing protein [Planctomycetaceae bacterium]|nr:DUF1080 domain-containing protein [Planctomycetaceae bacterium]
MHRLFVFASLALFASSQAIAGEPPAQPFDGKTLDAWTTAAGKPVPDGWEVKDGVIHLKPRAKNQPGGGNIVTAHNYGDFSLSFDWKITPKGNSGIKYRVRNYGKSALGLEYQMYDDGRKLEKGATASLYDLYPPSGAALPNPPGEWNTGRIIVRGNRIEHWLNGKQVVVAYVNSAEWQKRMKESKFNKYDDFAENRVGKLMITDHGSEVWLRNVRFETFDIGGSRSTLRNRLRNRLGL